MDCFRHLITFSSFPLDRDLKFSYLLSHKSATIKRAVLIRSRAEQRGEVGEESHRGDGHGAVGLRSQHSAVRQGQDLESFKIFPVDTFITVKIGL